MRALEIYRNDGQGALRWADRDMPVPAATEVLIRVEAAGLNHHDIHQRNNPDAAKSSEIPGLEVAGTIVKLGRDVVRWNEGDRVCALSAGGGYAEYISVPAAQCLPVPDGMTAIQAASLPETFFTVWSNVMDRAGIKPGETFLIQGGSSGIGVTAIQLLSARGHRVFATAGTDEKCRACVELGAERAINYKREDFVAVVREVTGQRGVDVILDMVGGDYIARQCQALADDGRLVGIAALAGKVATIDLREIYRRRFTITGSMLRPRSAEYKAAIAQDLEKHVWPLIASGRIKPIIHRVFDLGEAMEAHALMETSAHIGKIILDVPKQ